MKYWGALVAVGVALFFGGRSLGRTHTATASTASIDGPDVAAAPSPTLGSAAVAQRASMHALLQRLARTPVPSLVVDRATSDIERTAVEPADAMKLRRANVAAEIDKKVPGLAASKRSLLLAESDRLAWDKRSLRVAFLLGKMSETDYVDALKDDIRASLSGFEVAFTDEEYTALFNRARGSDADPFTLDSLVGRPRPSKDGPASGPPPSK